MNKIKSTTAIILTSLLLSCSTSTKIDYNSNSTIDNFVLEQTIYPTKFKLKITSKKATIDNLNDSVIANEVYIDIYNGSNKIYTVLADSSKIDQSKNIIILKDNIYFKNIIENNSILTANSINYDTDKQIMTINGNINLNYKNSRIKATQGKYFITKNELILSGIKDHRIFDNNNKAQKSPLIVIESSTTVINGNKGTIKFYSNNSKVRSKISLF